MGSMAPRNLRSVAITLTETVRACGVVASTTATSIVSSRLGAGRNVRRRLYDALKVLVAIKIIAKSKDGILKWNGYAHLSPVILRLDRKRNVIQQLAARIRLAKRKQGKGMGLVAPFVILRTHSATDISINNNNDIDNETERNNGNSNSVMIILNGYFQILNHSAIIARIARLLLMPSYQPPSYIYASPSDHVPWTRAIGPTGMNKRVEAIAPTITTIPTSESDTMGMVAPMSMSILDDNDNDIDNDIAQPPMMIIDDAQLSGIEAAAQAFDTKEFGGGSSDTKHDLDMGEEPMAMFSNDCNNNVDNIAEERKEDISIEPEAMLLLDSPAFEMALPEAGADVGDACVESSEQYGMDQWAPHAHGDVVL